MAATATRAPETGSADSEWTAYFATKGYKKAKGEAPQGYGELLGYHVPNRVKGLYSGKTAAKSSKGKASSSFDTSAYTVSALTKLYINDPKTFAKIGNRLAEAESAGIKANLDAATKEERTVLDDLLSRGILTEKSHADAVKQLEAAYS